MYSFLVDLNINTRREVWQTLVFVVDNLYSDYSLHNIVKMATLASLSSTRSFSLNVLVTDLQTQKSIEVNNESHVGFVMLEIVEKLGI